MAGALRTFTVLTNLGDCRQPANPARVVVLTRRGNLKFRKNSHLPYRINICRRRFAGILPQSCQISLAARRPERKSAGW